MLTSLYRKKIYFHLWYVVICSIFESKPMDLIMFYRFSYFNFLLS